MSAEGHRSSGDCLLTAVVHQFRRICMLYWCVMGKIRKAVSQLSSHGPGPMSRSWRGIGG